MTVETNASIDSTLERAVTRDPGVHGVTAVVTDLIGTLYEGAAGVRTVGQDAEMTTDTVLAVLSATKAIAGTVCLQLLEEGKLDLDAPAKRYAPAIGEVQVLDGFEPDGTLRLRAPKRDITTRMLLLHTAGFGYDIFNQTYKRLVEHHGQPSQITSTLAALKAPLLFDPGERWMYGLSMDWAGQVAEGITGARLGELMHERIFEPLEMTNTAFPMTADMRSRMSSIHQRNQDGSLTPLDLVLPQQPEVQMAGHGLYSTVEDYAKFIRMWLNRGTGPDGRVLRPETVDMASRNGLGDLKVTALRGAIPSMTHEVEFFPGTSKSWAMTFMVNDEDAPTGRSAGSLSWVGLANLYYWIDPHSGIGGVWATQIFPFFDPVSVDAYMDFETAVYRNFVPTQAR